MIYDHPVHTLRGDASSLAAFRGKALLIVNVASRCGFTKHYAGMQKLHDTYAARGFAVLGFPCNQFGAQEPGTPDEIESFCSSKFGVTFPLFEKIEVKGPSQHPIYAELSAVADASGAAGDVTWNFEKFVVSAEGAVTRFRPDTKPDDPKLVAAIEAALPK